MQIDHSTIGGASGGNTAAAEFYQFGGSGGGIFATGLGTGRGSLSITDSDVSDNSADAAFYNTMPGLGGIGGGIFASGSGGSGNPVVKISNSTVNENKASAVYRSYYSGGGAGGGIALSDASAQITGGAIEGNTASAYGSLTGGQGGGIFLDGTGSTLSVSGGAAITGNTAGAGFGSGGGGRGGGIALGTGDTLNLGSSTVSANNANARYYAAGEGGGIFDNGGIVRLTNATIGGSHQSPSGGTISDGNTAQGFYGQAAAGGGIFAENLTAVSGGALSLVNTSVSYNTAGNISGSSNSGLGGGLALINARSVGIKASTIDHNQAFGTSGGSPEGGGIYTAGPVSGDLSIANSTISDNLAADIHDFIGYSGGDGGGIAVNGPTVHLLNDTIAFNQAATGDPQSGFGNSDGISNATANTPDVENTIIAKNTSYFNGSETDVSGRFTSLGHNLIAIAAANGVNGFTNGINGDKVGGTAGHPGPLDPGLDPVLRPNPYRRNGVLVTPPTKTHALLRGSPAVNAADQNAPLTDQRGATRRTPGDPVPDIGAFELLMSRCGLRCQ